MKMSYKRVVDYPSLMSPSPDSVSSISQTTKVGGDQKAMGAGA